MTNKNYVFESFKGFLSSLESINESGEIEITPEDILSFMEDLIKAQMRMIKDKKRTKRTFGANIENPRKGFDLYVAELKKIGQKVDKRAYIRYATYLWPTVTEEEKIELSKFFYNQAIEKGHKTTSALSKLIEFKEDKRAVTLNPYIAAMPEGSESITSEPSIPNETSLLDNDVQSELFMDNEWKLNDKSFVKEGTKDKLVSGIRQILAQSQVGEISIDEIIIYTSTSRFRNTPGDGKDNSLSWGELSFKRAESISSLFQKIAIDQELSNSDMKILNNKIKIDYSGQNGDGTSGPNPPKGIRAGYYNENNEFIESDRSVVEAWELNDIGEPIKEAAKLEIPPLSDKDEYDEFKYVNIIVKYKGLLDGKTSLIEIPMAEGDNILYGNLPGTRTEIKKRKFVKPLKNKGNKKNKGKVDCAKWKMSNH